MGRTVVSLLCGGFTRKKSSPPSAVEEHLKAGNSEVALIIHEDASNKPWRSSASGRGNSHTGELTAKPPPDGDQKPLPPPPGRQQYSSSAHHLRTSSFHYHHRRSNSGAAWKFVFSMTVNVRGRSGGGATTTTSRKSSRRVEKKLNHVHEESIWKKTIILGEKCRVREEDDDAILYDENGKRISAYRPKKFTSISRQNSSSDQESAEILTLNSALASAKITQELVNSNQEPISLSAQSQTFQG
ncbi:uncharacterized protein LOC105177619 [Sesamum indicum]|uniref:Uncharacterized protein LOC105177619 n=1 Tax=Sesamum indicum TaxID=4182 RepID=A0A6I9UJM1_SESIN|nr:uncharacterized protein LOC105177619 [Sesamum indicum]